MPFGADPGARASRPQRAAVPPFCADDPSVHAEADTGLIVATLRMPSEKRGERWACDPLAGGTPALPEGKPADPISVTPDADCEAGRNG